MARIIDIDETIDEWDFDLAKLRLVKAKFPKVKLQIDTKTREFYFSDKSVSKDFTHFEFSEWDSAIHISAHQKIEFTHNDMTEEIIVSSIPKSTCLIHITWDYVNPKRTPDTIAFEKARFSTKNKDLQKKFYNDCSLKVLSFIKNHPDAILDKTNIDPRLEKLLIFS